MVSRFAVVALALCVVLSGCSTLPGSGGTIDDGANGEGTDLAVGGDGGGNGEGGDPGSGGSTPWETTDLTVGISAPAYENRSFAPAVRSAVEFWRPKTGSETAFDADLTVDPDATDPEIRVKFVPGIEECNGDTGVFYWCAPSFPEDADTYTVRVTGNLVNRTLETVTTRAFAAALATDADDVDGVPVTERPRFRDPWPGDPTVVAVDASATDRNVRPLVASTLAFWERHDDQYGNYTTEFVLRPDADDPDVVVRFVEALGDCGHEGDDGFVGCAPTLSDLQPAGNLTVVRIETGYTNESTRFALRHEFGHVYGLEHGEGPGSLMIAETDRLNWIAEPNVTERSFAWQSERIQVYVDRSSLPGSEAEIDRQLSAAFDYYRNGAGGAVPSSLTIEHVQDREAADVTVTGASMDAASNGTLYGRDTDVDPELEYYSEVRIHVSSTVDPEKLGWHVGYWLGNALIAPSNPTELPTPFDDPATDTRREWWP